MKNIQITLQPLSLIVGALLVGLVTVTVSAISPAGGPTDRDAQLMVIDGQSSARDRVLIRAGEANAYTVPTGKILIIDGLGNTTESHTASLYIDGKRSGIVRMRNDFSAGNAPMSIPGIRADSGSVVVVEVHQDGGLATGYLVDA
ncbi:MAG: hypothetical protein MK291_11765 [Planctomycetes bacterium]|nr:hypothetical protein [Planctomycetota bacterium]